MRRTNLVLDHMAEIRTELHEFRTEVRGELHAMNGRLDALNSRIDTVIHSVADLRRDFAQHTHES